MFVPDMPNVPPQNMPVMIAQANQAQPDDTATTRAVGVCSPTPSDSNNYSGENGIAPIAEARAYFQLFEHRTVAGSATVTVLQKPKHGILRLVTEADRGTLFDSSAGTLKPDAGLYAYLPEGYLGNDKAVIQVEIGGIKVKVVYYFQAVEGGLGSRWSELYCSKRGYRWKISSTPDANGNSALTSVEYQPSPIAYNILLAITQSVLEQGKSDLISPEEK